MPSQLFPIPLYSSKIFPPISSSPPQEYWKASHGSFHCPNDELFRLLLDKSSIKSLVCYLFWQFSLSDELCTHGRSASVLLQWIEEYDFHVGESRWGAVVEFVFGVRISVDSRLALWFLRDRNTVIDTCWASHWFDYNWRNVIS